MNETATFFLYTTLLAPLAGVILIALTRGKARQAMAMGTTLTTFAASLGLVVAYPGGAEFAFYQKLPWLGSQGYDISFALGVDGISLWLIVLSTLLFPLLVLYAWDRVKEQDGLFWGMLLLMEVGVVGFFMSLDLLLMYLCFELVLIPAIFFIGIWGGARRQYAALKFFLYTLLGSLVMLVGIIYLGTQGSDTFTTDYLLLREQGIDPEAQTWLFWAFAFSFAIKTPIFPLHTWQADAYAESSTTGTVIMAALLSKMGVYGLLRFCLPLFPIAFERFAPIFATLAVVGILYGAMVAFTQNDMKRLLAYSSLSHMGFIVLGIFALSQEAVSGSVLQMVAHGVSTAGLFFLVGMIERRGGSRLISDYQGIAKQLPWFAFLFVVSVMASVGLPGLSGFVGEFMIMVGAFDATTFGRAFAVLAAVGVVAAAVYLLTLTRKVLFGTPQDRVMPDLTGREVGLLAPLVILMFVIGLWATPFLRDINPSVDGILGIEQAEVLREVPATEDTTPTLSPPSARALPEETR